MRRATNFGFHRNDLVIISIHALREEGDLRNLLMSISWLVFLSTPSVRRATSNLAFEVCDVNISIHALREEGDDTGRADLERTAEDFYPRPP